MSSMTEATGRIRIIKIPGGDAPEVIREKWVGLELPCYPILGYPDRNTHVQVVSRLKVDRQVRGVCVPIVAALCILEEKDLHAARWFQAANLKPGESFFFAEDVIEIISGVRSQQMRLFPEEGVGSADIYP